MTDRQPRAILLGATCPVCGRAQDYAGCGHGPPSPEEEAFLKEVLGRIRGWRERGATGSITVHFLGGVPRMCEFATKERGKPWRS